MVTISLVLQGSLFPEGRYGRYEQDEEEGDARKNATGENPPTGGEQGTPGWVLIDNPEEDRREGKPESTGQRGRRIALRTKPTKSNHRVCRNSCSRQLSPGT